MKTDKIYRYSILIGLLISSLSLLGQEQSLESLEDFRIEEDDKVVSALLKSQNVVIPRGDESGGQTSGSTPMLRSGRSARASSRSLVGSSGSRSLEHIVSGLVTAEELEGSTSRSQSIRVRSSRTLSSSQTTRTTTSLYKEPEWLLKHDMEVTPTTQGLTIEASQPFNTKESRDFSIAISALQSEDEALIEFVADGQTVQSIGFSTISADGSYKSAFRAYIRRSYYFIASSHGEEVHSQTNIGSVRAGDRVKIAKDASHVYFYLNNTLLKTIKIKGEYQQERYHGSIGITDFWSDVPYNKMTQVKLEGFTYAEPKFAMDPMWYINYDIKTTPTEKGLLVEATQPYHEAINNPSRLLSMATLKPIASIEFVADGTTVQTIGFPVKQSDGSYKSAFWAYIRRNNFFIGSRSPYGVEEHSQTSIGGVRAGDRVKISKDQDQVYFYLNGSLLRTIGIAEGSKDISYYASVGIADAFSSAPYNKLSELRIEGLNKYTGNIPRWHIDRDEDGYGNRYNYITQTLQPDDFILDGSDCNDWDASVYTSIWYEDSDGDGKGDPNSKKEGCEQPEGYVSNDRDVCPSVASESANGCAPLPDPILSDQNYIYVEEPLEATASITTGTQRLQSIQYFDGLGRPTQSIGIQQSPAGKDLVTPIVYDEFGRPTHDYLPYESSQNTGAYIENTTAITGVERYYSTHYDNETHPFSQKELEASPLNRVLKQAAPGKAWNLGSEHEIEFGYETNTTDEVRRFDAKTDANFVPSLENKGYYGAGELYKTVTRDENHTQGKAHTIEEFKDKEGRVVLKRTYDDTESALDTYYVYDIYGNLSYVLPPKMKGSKENLSELGYQYQYDGRNRLVEKQLPGKDREYMVYDKQDRLVATQDGNLGKDKIWIFTKYDQFGRVLYTGKLTGGSRTEVQSAVNAKGSNNEVRSNTGFKEDDQLTIPYTNTGAYPEAKITTEVLMVNIYDDYPSESLGGASSIEGQPVITASSVPSTKGLQTASYVKVEGQSKWMKSYTYYDTKSRPVRVYTKNYLGGHTVVDSKLDFRGKTEYTKTRHKRTSSTTTEQETKTWYEYDHAERLVGTRQQDAGGQEVTLAHNVYDGLGQLQEKQVGNGLQKVDYRYNIRGWLTDINNATTNENPENDLFSFKIHYDSIETSIGHVKGLYNGNISQTQWKTANDNKLRSYGYEYDALNRINVALYEASGVTPNSYNVSNITYDENGNIKSLNRWMQEGVLMDQLTYTYDSGNRLMKVLDKGNGNGFKDDADILNNNQDYWYDVNGNMTQDKNKGITHIKYNHLNLPIEIVFAGGNKIEYLYDAAGMKLQKKVIEEGKEDVVTDYLDGYQYVDGVLEFYPHAEGYVNMKSGTPEYVYNYTDHLGNVRVSYVNEDGKAKIVEESNYYPFGLRHKGYNNQSNPLTDKYKYGYLGQERQDELGLNWHTYRYRNADPALGRFFGIDPVSEEYMSISTYQFAHNNPVWKIEIEGLEGQETSGNDVVNNEPVGIKGEFGIGFGKRVGLSINVLGIELSGVYDRGSARFEVELGVNENGDIIGDANAVYTEGYELSTPFYGEKQETKIKYKDYSSEKEGSLTTVVPEQNVNAEKESVSGYNVGNVNIENKVSEQGSFKVEEYKSTSSKNVVHHVNTSTGSFKGSGNKTKSQNGSITLFGISANAGISVDAAVKVEGGTNNPNPYSQSPGYYGSRCFIEGTGILMESGEQKVIEQIKVGDVIKTYNFNTKMIENKKVLHIDNPIHYHFVKMYFSNNVINVNTEDHPYYVKGKGWASFNPHLTKSNYNLDVKKIEINDDVYFYDDKEGSLINIKLIKLEKINKKLRTYNLSEVEDNHNFFANKILVHNKF